MHGRAVPLMGGWAILAGMWLPLVALCFYDNRVAEEVQSKWALLARIFVAGACMAVLGTVDDLRGLSARWKFMVQFPVALGIVASGVVFQGIEVPGVGSFHLGTLGPIVTVIWLVGVANAFNLIDGIDGLATGVGFLTALTGAIIAAINGKTLLAVVLVSMAGACLGFLPHNWSPARVFLGDTGSMFLGMTLATASAVAGGKGQLATSLLVPALLLSYPILDTLLAMTRRFLRGKSMFSGDASHIHHRLLHLGWNHAQTVLLLCGVCVLFNACTLAVVGKRLTWAGILFVLLLAMVLWGLRSLGYVGTATSRKSRAERELYRAHHHYAEMTKAKLRRAQTTAELVELFRSAAAEYGKLALAVKLPAGPWGQGLSCRWERNGDDTLVLVPSGAAGLVGDRTSSHEEVHAFPETGLRVTIAFVSVAGAEREELQLEKRQLLAEIARTADRRLRELSRSTLVKGRGDQSEG